MFFFFSNKTGYGSYRRDANRRRASSGAHGRGIQQFREAHSTPRVCYSIAQFPGDSGGPSGCPWSRASDRTDPRSSTANAHGASRRLLQERARFRPAAATATAATAADPTAAASANPQDQRHDWHAQLLLPAGV